MKNLIVVLSVFSCLLSVRIPAQENNTAALPKYFYKKLEGIIGEKYPIRMELIREDSVLRGYYYYENKKLPIYFNYNSRIDKNGNYLIEENAGNTESGELLITGRLTGRFVDAGLFEGKWQNADGTKTLSLKLTENYSDGCAKMNIRKYERNYGKSGDESFSFTAIYPEIILPDKKAEAKINERIKNSFREYYFEDSQIHFNSVEELADSFYAAYKADSIIAHDEKFYLSFAYDLSYVVDYNDNNILSLLKTLYQFTGGAHGSTFFTYLNFNLNTGDEIKPEDIFTGDYKTTLDKLGEEPFREYYQLKPDEDFEAAGFWFKDNVFAVNDNFGFNCEGIAFQYNQYEVAAYVLGAANITIPYNSVKNIIKQDGLLNFIK